MRNVTGPRILAMTLMAVAALALAGCGNGPKRRVTTTVTTTTPARIAAPVSGAAGVAGAGGASAGVADAGVAGANAAGTDAAGGGAAGDAAKRGGGAAAAPAAPPVNPDLRKTTDKLIAATIGFGVLADGVAQTAAGGGAGLAGARDQQCQNPFGSQPASNGQLICSSGEERLMCQCDDTGCRLVPTGIMACLPVGAVYQ